MTAHGQGLVQARAALPALGPLLPPLIARSYRQSSGALIAASNDLIASQGSFKSSRKLPQLTSRGQRPAPPRHLAILLADSDAASQPAWKIAEILNWCQDRGIRSAVVYHPEGLSSCQAERLRKLLRSGATCQVGFDGAVLGCGETRDPEPAGTWPAQQAATADNDSCGAHCMRIILLNSADTERRLVQASRASTAHDAAPALRLATAQSQEELQPGGTQGRTRPADSTLLRDAGSEIEPELTLVFGEALTTAGFPPWLIRVSEIYRLGSLRDATPPRLAATLQAYSHVTQRFGT